MRQVVSKAKDQESNNAAEFGSTKSQFQGPKYLFTL